MKLGTVFLSLSVLTSACATPPSRGPASVVDDHAASKASSKDGVKELPKPEAGSETLTLEKPESCSSNSKVCQNYFNSYFLPQFDQYYGQFKISSDIKFKGVTIPKGTYSVKAMLDLLEPIFKSYQKSCAIKLQDPSYLPTDSTTFSKLYHPCVVQRFAEDYAAASEKTKAFDVHIGDSIKTNFLGLFQTVSAMTYYYYSTVAPWVAPSDQPSVTAQYFPAGQETPVSLNGAFAISPDSSALHQFNIGSGTGNVTDSSTYSQAAYNPYNWSAGVYFFNAPPEDPNSPTNDTRKILEIKTVQH
jgi:hypothetical protein